MTEALWKSNHLALKPTHLLPHVAKKRTIHITMACILGDPAKRVVAITALELLQETCLTQREWSENHRN